MSVERDVTEVRGLLSEIAEHLDELESLGVGPGDTPLAGDGPSAAENRTIHAARATLARDRAREMRSGLADIKVRARDVAEQARRARAAPGGGPARCPAEAADHEHPVRGVARGLVQAEDPDEVQHVLARGLHAAIPGVAVAGVCRRHHAAGSPVLEVVAGDPALAGLVDAENAAGHGPCLDVLAGDVALVEHPDLPGDARWPAVASCAEQLGLGSVLVHRLAEREDGRDGVLVVYGRSPAGFGRPARATIASLADLRGIALAGARRCASIGRALESRDLIGQAKGILMHRGGIDADRAFAALVEASQHTNTKLRDVASWLVDEHGRTR